MNAEEFSAWVDSIPTVSEEQRRDYEWRHEIKEQMDRNRIPDRYRIKDPDWSEPKQKAVFEKCRDTLKGVGSIVALSGGRGLGKTYLACQLVIDRIWDQWSSGASLFSWMPYRKLSDLLERYKPLYADFGSINGDELASARDTLCRAPLLIIDEVAESEDSKIRSRMLPDILDRRYANLTDTILISNLEPKILPESLGESIMSRIREHGGIIPCSWPSFRQ